MSARGFPLKWELPLTKSTFPSFAKMPFRPKERDRLADVMTYDQILLTSEALEDSKARRHRKWKEIRNFWNITRQPEYNRYSIENAFWTRGESRITVDNFITGLISEYKFHPSLRIENNLRWMYWAFEGGSKNAVDWRDVLACFKIVIFYRMVRNHPEDLLISLFDIYAHGGDDPNAKPNDEWYIPVTSTVIRRIFHLPCESNTDVSLIDELFDAAFAKYSDDLGTFETGNMTRRAFKKFIQANENLVRNWKCMAWERLPSELRLQVLNEAQVQAQQRADVIMFKFKLRQALAMATKSLARRTFRDWVLFVVRGHKVRRFLKHKLARARRDFFRFWRKFTLLIMKKRRRVLLAEIMGCYTLKARCFARIKLHNYTIKKINAVGGYTTTRTKVVKEGLSHIRNYRRLHAMRRAFHNWWHETAHMMNTDLAIAHDYRRRLIPATKEWFRVAHISAQERRMEMVVLENKLYFDRMMEEVDENARVLVGLELERENLKKEQEEERKQAEKKKKFDDYANQRQVMREEDRRIVLQIQRDARQKRIRKQWKKIKRKFEKQWVKKKAELLRRAKNSISVYLASKENKLAIQMRFDKFNREFHAPPTPETVDREKLLTSPKNLVFLHLEARLYKEELTIKDAMTRFDTDGKGYLTYEEFQKIVESLGIKMDSTKMYDVVRGVDADGDGVIDLKELEQSMLETEQLGVKGSPWKLYVDPAQDVICYHNFTTDEKILEYDMTDVKLMEVMEADMYGEAESNAIAEARKLKEEDWVLTQRSYYAKRLQFMYRQWAARKRRQKAAWKAHRLQNKTLRKNQKTCLQFIEWCFIGYKSRALFKKELHLTFEKVWDVESGKMFWYNHHTRVSTWERPQMLWRYGDVTSPSPWVPLDVPVPVVSVPDTEREDDGASGGSGKESKKKNKKKTEEDIQQEQQWELHYYHVPAQRQIPRKPDGLPLCSYCVRNMAIHKCVDCAQDFCFSCHRLTHSSPFGFMQKDKLTVEQAEDPAVVEKLRLSLHNWTLVSVPKCETCHSEKMAGAFRCENCDKVMCRPCCRRIHAPESMAGHKLAEI